MNQNQWRLLTEILLMEEHQVNHVNLLYANNNNLYFKLIKGSDHGWEPVDFKPATQLKATDDSTTENEQSQLTFRILTKRHSRGNLLSSLSRHMNQHLHPALTTHSRTSSEPNIAKVSVCVQ